MQADRHPQRNHSTVERRSRRLRRFLVVAAVAALVFVPKPKLLLYNRTPSLPVGWYVYAGQTPQRGDIVAFTLPTAAHAYAMARGESTGVRLLKQVLATGGDRVSTLHGLLYINGVLIGTIPAVDSAGRTLPHWQADRVLTADELFVGTTASHSFDSRFFGPIRTEDVQGVYRPLCVDSTTSATIESTLGVHAVRAFPRVAMTCRSSQR